MTEIDYRFRYGPYIEDAQSALRQPIMYLMEYGHKSGSMIHQPRVLPDWIQEKIEMGNAKFDAELKAKGLMK